MEVKKVNDFPLSVGQYNQDEFVKAYLLIHHTAGNHHPEWTIGGWDADSRGAVATTTTIGGISTRNGDNSQDGKICRAFPERKWGWHIYYNPSKYQVGIEQHSVGIEICNYGFLKQDKAGRFYNYVNAPIDDKYVIELDKPHKGFKFWHNYTDAQIDSVCSEVYRLTKMFQIPTDTAALALIKAQNVETRNAQNVIILQKALNQFGENLVVDGVCGPKTLTALSRHPHIEADFLQSTIFANSNTFYVDNQSWRGPTSGVYFHGNMREDKNDAYPHPKLIESLRTL